MEVDAATLVAILAVAGHPQVQTVLRWRWLCHE